MRRPARDVDGLPRAQVALALGRAHAHRALEHLEVLVLGGVVVGRRRGAAGVVGGLELEQLGRGAHDRDALVRPDLQRLAGHAS